MTYVLSEIIKGGLTHHSQHLVGDINKLEYLRASKGKKKDLSFIFNTLVKEHEDEEENYNLRVMMMNVMRFLAYIYIVASLSIF